MRLQLRWIGELPAAGVEAVLLALAPDCAPVLSSHPGGPQAGRTRVEGTLDADEARPGWLPELLRIAQERGDDALLVPAEWRPLRPRLACFDGDMTLVDAETIDVLGELAGVGGRIAAVTARAMAGELDFASALRERVALLAGLPASALERARERIALMSGARELLGALHDAGCRSAVLSGGFHFLLDPIARELGIAVVRANALELRDGRSSGRLSGPILDAAAKAEALTELAGVEALSPRELLAVGDGANDGPMLARAGVGVAFCPKPALRAQACGVVSGRDLGRLPALLDL